MSVDTYGSDDKGLATGLEDVDESDIRIPRLNIDHKKGVLVDNLSNQEYPRISCVLLGLVKQRIMWHHEVGGDEKPLCKSPDFKTGFPVLSGQVHTFPWERSDFNEGDYVNGADSIVTLPCAKCNFKEWKTHYDGKKPACAEQHTFPLLYDPSGDEATVDNLDALVPALFTVQHSGIKPSKDYMSSYVRLRSALYTNITTLSLDTQRRGSNTYCVPVFKGGAKTQEEDYPWLSQQYKSIRSFVHSTGAPRNGNDARTEEVDSLKTDEPSPPGPKAADPEPEHKAAEASGPVANASVDEDDLPF